MRSDRVIRAERSSAASYLAGPTVEVRVGTGNDSQPFYIHVDLLRSRSDFFAAALRGYKTPNSSKNSSSSSIEILPSWKEATEGLVHLPDDKPSTFAAYVQLIYYSSLPIYDQITLTPDSEHAPSSADKKKAEEGSTCAAVNAAVTREFNLLSDLYILTEKLQDLSAKRAVLRAFIESTALERADGKRRYPVYSTIGKLYAGTVEGDPMRTFLVDCWVLYGHKRWAGKDPEGLPHEFMFGVMVGMFNERAVPTEKSRVEDPERYCAELREPWEKRGESMNGK